MTGSLPQQSTAYRNQNGRSGFGSGLNFKLLGDYFTEHYSANTIQTISVNSWSTWRVLGAIRRCEWRKADQNGDVHIWHTVRNRCGFGDLNSMWPTLPTLWWLWKFDSVPHWETHWEAHWVIQLKFNWTQNQMNTGTLWFKNFESSLRILSHISHSEEPLQVKLFSTVFQSLYYNVLHCVASSYRYLQQKVCLIIRQIRFLSFFRDGEQGKSSLSSRSFKPVNNLFPFANRISHFEVLVLRVALRFALRFVLRFALKFSLESRNVSKQ